MWHNMWNDGWMMHSWGFGMWVAFLVAIALIALMVVLVTRNAAEAPVVGPSSGDALDVLERRYAEGEIDDGEFERRKRALQENVD